MHFISANVPEFPIADGHVRFEAGLGAEAPSLEPQGRPLKCSGQTRRRLGRTPCEGLNVWNASDMIT